MISCFSTPHNLSPSEREFSSSQELTWFLFIQRALESLIHARYPHATCTIMWTIISIGVTGLLIYTLSHNNKINKVSYMIFYAISYKIKWHHLRCYVPHGNFNVDQCYIFLTEPATLGFMSANERRKRREVRLAITFSEVSQSWRRVGHICICCVRVSRFVKL